MTEHDPETDKHGNDVSDFVREAVEALRDDPYILKVLCDYYRTGMLQVWFVKRYVQGSTIRTAREHGYQLASATTRTDQDFKANGRYGYMELIPQENDREPENQHQIS